ncbi:MAG TPA: ATP-binding protein [Candidatus Limnocylindria bacterium]|nr:ATP-binding protein [Candidatus Limnocylindria bacterium]
MSALELVTLAVQLVYASIFLVTARNAVRRPTRANVNIALFFGALVVAIVNNRVTALIGPIPVAGAVAAALVMALPYILLRLLDDFVGVPAVVQRLTEGGLALAIVAIAVSGTPLPPMVTLPLVAYFAVVALYVAVRFVRESGRGHGVTRRRMQAVGLGIGLLGIAILAAGIVALTPPDIDAVISGVQQTLALGSGIAFFVGFAPPRGLRRAWQEPELRGFLKRAASLPRLPDTASIVRELERGAAKTLGARASIGLWDPEAQVLRFSDPHGALPETVAEGRFLAWRVFHEQRAAYFADAAAAHPENRLQYERAGVSSVLLAPITAGERRLGVLEVFAARAPIFDEDDLALVELLADQAAVTLESRALIDEATRVRAQEQATLLKEEFLSAAAHDLKTPLTTLVAQAQFLERKAQRDPSAPMDLPGLGRIVREAKRLSALVMELLDVDRLEHGKLVGEREPTDLVETAREVADATDGGRVTVDATGPVVGRFDRQRVAQLFANLVENALKYSSPDSPVLVKVWEEGPTARISVQDHGIGIPPDEVGLVFERFRRASNVDDRRFSGMGLGLYICKGIVEQHGGRIWVESELGTGSTFNVALPHGSDGRVN